MGVCTKNALLRYGYCIDTYKLGTYIMKKTIFFLPLILVFYLFTSCKTITNTNNFTIISYGISAIRVEGLNYNYKNSDAFSNVAKRWGITFISNGCVINNSLRRKIEKDNKEAYKNIERKFGKDWKDRFNAEVKEEMKKYK